MIRCINLGACFCNESAVPARLRTDTQTATLLSLPLPVSYPGASQVMTHGAAQVSVSSFLSFPEEVGRGEERKEKGKKEHGIRKGNGT